MVRRWLVRMRPARLQVICSTATVAEALPSYEPRCWAALPDGTAATGATSVQVPSCNGTRKQSCRLQDCRDDCFPEGTVNGNVDALTTHWLIGNVAGLPSPIEPIEGGRPETPALGERPGPEVHSVGDGHGQGVGGQVPREAKPHRRRVSVRPPSAIAALADRDGCGSGGTNRTRVPNASDLLQALPGPMDAEESGTQVGSVTMGEATEPTWLYGAKPECDALAPRAEVTSTGVT